MSNLKIGDIVWAKIMGFPRWPSVILKPIDNMPKPSDHTNKYFWVYFFGSDNYAWIPKSRLSHYEENRDKNIEPQNSYLYFTEAVDEADKAVARMKNNPNYKVMLPTEFVMPNIQEKIKKKRKRGTRREKKIKLKRLTADLPKRTKLENIETSKGVLDTREILTSQLTFGVLGMGIIGSGVVKNLVRSGHAVNIWNRTMSKCDQLVDELGGKFKKQIKSFFSPRALLQSSDIVFICVSNQEVANTIFRNSFGINNPKDTVLKNKGVVQMTTTGPETSKDIEAVIEKQGGKYLEAQIQGSKTEAIEGNLLILAAGEQSLFYACQSCFKAIGKTAMYLGQVGYASKLNLILQLIKGVNLAVLAEGLSLAERCGVPHKEFIAIFNTCPLASPYLMGKANIILQKDFNNVEQALKHLQKDLKLGLNLADNEQEPMYLASTANEMFKHCRRLEYSGHDAATIFMRNKH